MSAPSRAADLFTRWGIIALIVLAGIMLPGAGSAQINSGASLTVLRGTIAVVRADGSALSPAPSGLALGVGDQIASLANSGALVTFFEGSEVELGSDTTIVIKEASGQGNRTNITLNSVVGSSVHRVVTLTDSGSSYKVESGGTVGLVQVGVRMS